MLRHPGNGLIAFSPSAADDATCEWKAIWKEQDWRCCFVRVLPPRVSAQLFKGIACALPPGVLVLQEGSERNVLEAAAWDGFAECTHPYLDKLSKLRDSSNMPLWHLWWTTFAGAHRKRRQPLWQRQHRQPRGEVPSRLLCGPKRATA